MKHVKVVKLPNGRYGIRLKSKKQFFAYSYSTLEAANRIAAKINTTWGPRIEAANFAYPTPFIESSITNMCELNPKHKKIFKLEFFSAFGEQEDFENKVIECLLKLELEFNQLGRIRVHVHEDND